MKKLTKKYFKAEMSRIYATASFVWDEKDQRYYGIDGYGNVNKIYRLCSHLQAIESDTIIGLCDYVFISDNNDAKKNLVIEKITHEDDKKLMERLKNIAKDGKWVRLAFITYLGLYYASNVTEYGEEGLKSYTMEDYEGCVTKKCKTGD